MLNRASFLFKRTSLSSTRKNTLLMQSYFNPRLFHSEKRLLAYSELRSLTQHLSSLSEAEKQQVLTQKGRDYYTQHLYWYNFPSFLSKLSEPLQQHFLGILGEEGIREITETPVDPKHGIKILCASVSHDVRALIANMLQIDLYTYEPHHKDTPRP